MSYRIENVPLYQQIGCHGCGAAAAQVILDYHGPLIGQKEISNTARLAAQVDDTIPDLKPSMGIFLRATHFSSLSFTPNEDPRTTWGHTNGTVGYSWFFYASDTS